MTNSTYISVEVFPVSQYIGIFYLGKMTPADLYAIANKNLARVKDLEKGIQREPVQQKLVAIRKYIGEKDATFPNTIILAISNNPVDETPTYKFDGNTLQILRAESVANVLDGQHRLFAFEPGVVDFELPVAIFLDMPLSEQAKIFATINSTQTKVNLTLVYDLFGITEERGPEKVAYQIVKHLNTEPGSAWRNKIKTLSDRSGDLAQGSMAKFIHKELLTKHDVFKKLYAEERDTDIKNILMNYFNAIQISFPKQWSNETKEFILTKTTGFNGFMIFFLSLVTLGSLQKQPLSTDYFASYINRVKKKFEEFISDNYESGARGQNKIRDTLRSGLTEEERELVGGEAWNV